MPDPEFDRKGEALKFVGAPSFDGAPICFGTNESRPRPAGGAPSTNASLSDDKGKAAVVEGDTDVSSVTGKEPMNVASSSSSSSSSSTVAEIEDMSNLTSGSSSQHDEAEHTKDVPEAPLILRRVPAITPMNESDDNLYWQNTLPNLFEDTLEQANTTSGLGNDESMRLMGLPEQPEHDADPHPAQPEAMLIDSSSFVTYQVPGFSMGLRGGVVPFAEVQSVEVRDAEHLGIFVNPRGRG